AGIDVELDVPEDLAAAAAALNRGRERGLRHSRALVTAQTALTLDGRAAAADGTSQWITGPAAREEVHLLRTTCDTVLVGTGTARIDQPTLTARRPDGALHPRQPLRAVMGTSAVPTLPAVEGAGQPVRLATRDPSAALAELFARGARHVLLGGGPTLTAAFLRAGIVDELILHLAPTLLGAGRPAVADLAISTLADRLDLELVRATPLPSPGGPTAPRPTPPPRPHADPLPACPRGHRPRRLARRERLLPHRHRARGRQLDGRRHLHHPRRDLPGRPGRRRPREPRAVRAGRRPPGRAHRAGTRRRGRHRHRPRGGRRHHPAAPRPARGPVALRGRQGLPRRGRGEPHRRRDRRRGGHPRPHPRDPLPHHPRRPRGRRPREPRGGRAGEVRREAHREPPARSGGRPMNAPHPGPVPLAPVEDAIAAIAAGRAVVVVDDEDRENEGDLILAASAATPELIGFAVRHSSGLLCAPMGAERADALELPLMV